MTIGSIFRPLLELCRESGTDVAELLRQDGLTEKKLVDPETRLPTMRSRALARRIFAALGDPEAGLRAGERFRLEDADLIGFLARHSRLRAILARRADDVLATLPEAVTLDVQVRGHIQRRLAEQSLGLDAIARDLGMSERTLRRRLKESGHGYRELLDQVRSERAIALADEGRHSVTALAELVGFADATAFTRAFLRWKGSAPQAYLRAPSTH